MDEELIAQLEQAVTDSDSVFGDGKWLKAALQEIRRLDSVVKYYETRAHHEMYGRKSSALYGPTGSG